jgi:cyanate lyase
MERVITRDVATEQILAAREATGLSFAAIAEHIGRDPVWTTSALLGQQRMDAAEADAVCEMLHLDTDVSGALQRQPSKGSLDPTVPTDPLIYRFHEIVQVYGTTLKALIEEEFGDGIMSAIDFEMRLERRSDPRGDRVVVTMDGKFLPYRKW